MLTFDREKCKWHGDGGRMIRVTPDGLFEGSQPGANVPYLVFPTFEEAKAWAEEPISPDEVALAFLQDAAKGFPVGLPGMVESESPVLAALRCHAQKLLDSFSEEAIQGERTS